MKCQVRHFQNGSGAVSDRLSGAARPDGPILAAALPTVLHPFAIESATDNVVPDAWQVFYSAAANQNHGVLLKVVAFAADVRGYFHTIGQANSGNLP